MLTLGYTPATRPTVGGLGDIDTGNIEPVFYSTLKRLENAEKMLWASFRAAMNVCDSGYALPQSYVDDHNARVTGPGRIIGVDTERFYRAVQAAVEGCSRIDRWPEGTGFEAFVAPTYWPTVTGPDEQSQAALREELERMTGGKLE